ncbi:MAG: DUF4253 domain-containing protein [Pseudomonadota bacterium]
MRWFFSFIVLSMVLSSAPVAAVLANSPIPSSLPYEVVTTSGEHALREWERLRDEGDGWPVIVGGDEDLQRLAEDRETAALDTEQALAAAEALTHPGSLEAHWSGLEESTREILVDRGLETPATIKARERERRRTDEDVLNAPWPTDVAATQGPYSVSDLLEDRFLDTVHIVVLPSMDPTEAPAHLGLGDWNGNPPAQHHVAAFRSWRERYGAVPVVIQSDTIEMRVSRRPETREEAMALATEMYRYNEDIILQGDGCVPCLAATLMVSDWWYFWWD